MNRQSGAYKTLAIMLIAATIFGVVGLLVVRKRIVTPYTPPNQQSSDNQQNSNDDQTQDDSVMPSEVTSDWKIYVNDKHGFSVRYPASFKAGSVSGNSVLGTFQEPVHGLHVGPFVLIALKDLDLKKQAQEYFSSFYETALNPPPGQTADGPGPIECKTQTVSNSKVLSLKTVSCDGEGGPAKYAYITGPDYDVFVDGYSGGYDDLGGATPPGRLPDADFIAILSTFAFSTDVAVKPPPTPNPTPLPEQTTNPSPTPGPSPVPAPTPNPTSPVQTFSINADDSQATPNLITVPKGTIVEITFNVGSNVYYGGLEFRSAVANSGVIHAGESKTISFIANQTFAFKPYWPSSNVEKGYSVAVTVN